MCGVFGIFGDPDAARLTALGLFALQHRGEESAGLVVAQDGQLSARHGLGLVSEILPPAEVAKFSGHSAIGHARYATCWRRRFAQCRSRSWFATRTAKSRLPTTARW